MDLPDKGREVPLPEIKKICEAHGLMKLWAKIEKDPPPKPFKSDGCSSIVPKFSWIYLHGCLFLPMDFNSGIN